MSFNRAEIIDQSFIALVQGWKESPATRPNPGDPAAPGATLTGRDLVELFETQMTARHLT
jgi:hypothetical protein